MARIPKFPKGLKASVRKLENKAKRKKAIEARKREIEALKKKRDSLRNKL